MRVSKMTFCYPTLRDTANVGLPVDRRCNRGFAYDPANETSAIHSQLPSSLLDRVAAYTAKTAVVTDHSR